MTGVVRFIKTTLFGGLFVVLPIVLLYLIALKALQLAVKLSTPIAAVVPADLSPVKSPLLIAVVLIVGASFLVGLAMYSSPARRFGRRLEMQTLGRFPPYKFLKGMTGAMAGGSDGPGFHPALLTQPNGTKVFVLIIEEHGDHAATVFVPSAPTPTIGTVQIAARDRLQPLDAKGGEVLQVLGNWGVGARSLLEKARPDPALQRSAEIERRP
jgi:uncharacterized membrane protein